MTSEAPTILDRIVADKRQELARRQREQSFGTLQQLVQRMPSTRSLATALRAHPPALIAEIKRASPSRGLLRADLDAAALARTYAEAGAAAISVLTEERHFQGSLADLKAVRQALDDLGDARPPLIRKDFIFDVYQLFEARAHGADAILLIAAILNADLLTSFIALARTLGLECLVEVHDELELERALVAGAEIIGINNRDLRTFEVDLATAERLRPLIPPEVTVVAESGVHTRADVQRLAGLGVHGVLIGEALVLADDPAGKIRQLFPGARK
jgi:indole-3-glycerol phosphate synthase